jgi:hypothetical protein
LEHDSLAARTTLDSSHVGRLVDVNRLPRVFRGRYISSVSSPTCLNCGAALSGAFCARCGQRDVPSYPNVRELATDAFQELSGWDGRIATTVRALLARPGKLTVEFLQGRRARYLSPLRLYLTASVAYFVLAAASPEVRLPSGKLLFLGIRVGASSDAADSRPERVAGAAGAALANETVLTDSARAAVLAEIESAPALMRPFLRRSLEDPDGFKRGLIETLPKMLFVLLPAFAAIVGLLYRGRKYPEHLYFAIHLHAYIFFVLAVTELVKFTGFAYAVIAAAAVALPSIPIYAVLALRRVYGNGLGKTLLKSVAIAAIYFLTTAIAFVGTVYWVSVRAA